MATKKANKSAATDQTETTKTTGKTGAAAKTAKTPTAKTAKPAATKTATVKATAKTPTRPKTVTKTLVMAENPENGTQPAIPETNSTGAIPEAAGGNIIDFPVISEASETATAQIEADQPGTTVYKFDNKAGQIGQIRLEQAAQELNVQFGDTAGEMLLAGTALYNELGDWYSLDQSQIKFKLDKALERRREESAELLGNESDVIDTSIEYDKLAQAEDAANVEFPIIDANAEDVENDTTGGNPENPENGGNPSTALVKSENETGVIDAIPTEALSEAETARREELESKIRVEAGEHLRTSFVIGASLDEIISNRLHRSTHANVESYVMETFGFSREYANHLIGASRAIMALQAGKMEEQKVFGQSVNTMFFVHRRTKQIAETAGISETEMQGFTNLLTNLVFQIADETAPKDSVTGKSLISARHINNVAEVIKDFLKSGAVEIGGHQFPLGMAGETIGSLGVDAHVAQTTYEQLAGVKDKLAEEVKGRTERMKSGNPKRENVETNGSAAKGSKKEKRDLPVLSLGCSEHGAVTFDAILPGRAVLSCGCAFENIEGEGIVCVQIAGEVLRQTKPSKSK